VHPNKKVESPSKIPN